MDMATRSTIQNEASKILAIINGGGAVALATFMQAVWDKWDVAPRGLLITALSYLTFGLAVVPVTLVLRYVNGLLSESYSPFRNPWWYAIIVTYFASVVCFLMGMSAVILAAQTANAP